MKLHQDKNRLYQLIAGKQYSKQHGKQKSIGQVILKNKNAPEKKF